MNIYIIVCVVGDSMMMRVCRRSRVMVLKRILKESMGGWMDMVQVE